MKVLGSYVFDAARILGECAPDEIRFSKTFSAASNTVLAKFRDSKVKFTFSMEFVSEPYCGNGKWFAVGF
ncbi:MAG: hypothetical protein OXC26_24450 [Albidovulum sp.]|nr:hypothetical protein [Albidovulum sp.]